MSLANLWIALSTQAIQEFQNKKADPNYSGPMDDYTFNVLSKMHDMAVVQNLFKTVTSGKTYKMFSLYLEGSTGAKDAIDDLTAKWPTHIIAVGVWWHDGRQVGTQYDEQGQAVGDPSYPIHSQAWKFMPDQNEYDGDGNVIGTISATSNADLTDVNLLAGQSPRRFT